jgi:uncharacterized protein
LSVNRKNNYDIQVTLETGKITYTKSKEDTKILFYETESNMRSEETTHFDFPYSQLFDLENCLSNVRSLELNISQTCNMNCTYCFGDGGTYGNLGMMSFKTAKKAIDLFYNTSKKNNVRVNFFGGEPLLNFKLIKEITSYITNQFNDYDTEYYITTNGTIINEEILDFIRDYQFIIQVSLDGNQFFHDKYRKFSNGMPTYEVIISNLKKMRELGIFPRIRSTFCHGCTENNSLLMYINELDAEVHMSPVLSKGRNLLLDQDDLNIIYQEFLEIFEDALKFSKYKGVLFNRDLRNMILHCFEAENLPFLIPKPYFCGAGSSMLSVDISGDIYPCHGFIGNEKFNLGNVDTNIDIHKLKQFVDCTHIANKKECLNCDTRNICGGGCRYYFYETNGDLNSPHEGFCGLMKTLYKLAIIFYVNLKEKGIPKELVESTILIKLNDILMGNEDVGAPKIYS